MAAAIEIDGVSKKFRLHTEPSKTMKERALHWRQNSVAEFFALRDVHLDIAQGETVGLLGHNGSGKSTLLKCIAGTLRPTSGEIRVNGRISAMLELGAGFHPDLTGRENVYLNGSILGFSKDHVSAIFDDIVEFSELDDFIDSQVKHYSSGMYARLGFAVAVNLEPDVLLVDEVLSVGDEAFQRKCIERVRQFQHDGRTIVLVTHSPDQVRQVCDRAAVLDHGRMIFEGDPNEAAGHYRRSLDGDTSGLIGSVETEGESTEPEVEQEIDEKVTVTAETPESPVSITGCSVSDPADGRDFFAPGDDLTLTVSYKRNQPVYAMRARVLIKANDGVQMLNISTYDLNGSDIWDVADEGEVQFRIVNLPLMDHRYHVSFVLQEPDETTEFDHALGALAFDVVSGRPIVGRTVFDIGVEHHPGSAE